MKTGILVMIVFIFLILLANSGENVTSATSVSELHPVFSYEDATIVAESL